MIKRIFISYSGKDPSSVDLCNHLYYSFRQKGFDVFVDRKKIVPGSRWRDEIYTWLGLCHAGIIILSKKALEKDCVWVPRETAILTWRQHLQPELGIIPILMPGIQVEDLHTNEQYRELRIDSIQSISHQDNKSTKQALISKLSQLKDVIKTPYEEISDQIEMLLGHIREDIISRALDRISINAVESFNNPKQSLALSLLQVPLIDAVKVLEYLVPFSPDLAAIDRIFDIIAPGWVDLRAARWILICARKEELKPAIVLNAASKFAAEMYVRRASCKPSKNCWQVIPITAVYGENAFEDIAREIWQSLKNYFDDALIADPFDDSPDQELITLLQHLNQLGRPAVIVMKLPPQANTLITRLRDQYPYLTFLFLSGPELPDPGQYPETLLKSLRPVLNTDMEAAARKNFITARSILRPGG